MNKKSFSESFEKYNNEIESAIAEILSCSPDQAKEVAKKMPFKDYLDFAMAIETDEEKDALAIIRKYIPNMVTVESVAQEIHYLIKECSENVLTPNLKHLTDDQKRKIFEEMSLSELHKILANTRGYSYPGNYENQLTYRQSIKQIIENLKDTPIKKLTELQSLAPGEQNRAAAYGERNQTAPTGPANKGPATNKATYYNDKGEAEEGEVLSTTGNQVKVKTATGIKFMNKDDLVMAQESKIIELKGRSKK